MVLAGRNATRLNAPRQEISVPKPGRPHIAIAADVGSAESVAALFAQVRERFGRLDVLFNDAGVFVPAASFEDVTLEQWNQLIATNLTGTFLCTREAFWIMKHQTPRGDGIIDNGSISAHVPSRLRSLYRIQARGSQG